MSDDESTLNHNIRMLLKMVRDPTKTAYDLLPTGETIGAFANRHVVETYKRKILVKREKARESRKRNRNAIKSDEPNTKKQKT